jgi:hypothetical protein
MATSGGSGGGGGGGGGVLQQTRALKTGDVVCFSAMEGSLEGGMLHVEGFADDRVNLSMPSAIGTYGDFRGHLFRVIGEIPYSARAALTAMQSRPAKLLAKEALHRKMQEDSNVNEQQEYEKQLRIVYSSLELLRERVVKEEKRSKELIEDPESLGKAVLYDQTIQLQHMRTKKFLTMMPVELAQLEKNCVKLTVTAGGNENSWFTIKAKFKFRQSGSPVYDEDQVMFIPNTRLTSSVRCHEKGEFVFADDPTKKEVRTNARVLHSRERVDIFPAVRAADTSAIYLYFSILYCRSP